MAQLSRFKAQQSKKSLRLIKDRQFSHDCKIVAEGDSWFAYPLVKDVVDQLRKMGYAVIRCSEPGDTLENMVYGSGYKINKKKNTVSNKGAIDLKEVKEAIRSYKPRFVLFSAGGNDVVGIELVRYLYHKSTGKSSLRIAAFQDVLNNFMKPAIEHFIKEVLAVDPAVDILMDGYDYAKPIGKGYKLVGVKLAGPWILPGFGEKAITKRSDQDRIIKRLIDEFNEMLKDLSVTYTNFHYINLRGKFPEDKQWHNEIHLKAAGYKTVAGLYHEEIVRILGGRNPLK